jgi:eukaryotic-like serine/threonine-protein kinase
VTTSERFVRVAALPSSDGWTSEIAVDRGAGAGAARAVVVSTAPVLVSEDPARLAALVRDVEAAARLHHANVVPVIGLEPLGEGLAIVETHRNGVTLRALLEAGGRLPADVAARIALDACAGVAFASARDAGEGKGLAHGRLAPERLVVGDDGLTAVAGFGGGGEEATPAADATALAAILYECLAGEPAPSSPRPLDVSGIPEVLGAVLFRALRGGGYPTAEAFAEAVTASADRAPREAVAAYVEAIVPADEGERAALAFALRAALPAALPAAPRKARDAEEVAEDLILGEPTPLALTAPAADVPDDHILGEPTPIALPAPPADVTDALVVGEPEPDLKPNPKRQRATAAAPVEAACREPRAVALPAPPEPAHVVDAPAAASHAAAPGAPTAVAVAVALSGPPPDGFFEPTPAATTAPSLSDAQILPIPPRPRPGGAWWAITAVICVAFAAVGFAAGLMVERSQRAQEAAAASAGPVSVVAQPTEAAAATPPPAPVLAPAPAPAAPDLDPDLATAASTPTPTAKGTATPIATPKRRPTPRPIAQTAPSRPSLEIGWLDVDAPADAEIFVDGRRIGRGEVRRHELPEGKHRVDVMLGDAKTGETFTVGPRETYTYEVHQTPN